MVVLCSDADVAERLLLRLVVGSECIAALNALTLLASAEICAVVTLAEAPTPDRVPPRPVAA